MAHEAVGGVWGGVGGPPRAAIQLTVSVVVPHPPPPSPPLPPPADAEELVTFCYSLSSGNSKALILVESINVPNSLSYGMMDRLPAFFV